MNRKLFNSRGPRRTHLLGAALLAVVLTCAALLTACHGSQGLPAFEVPEQWDSSKEYEITSWPTSEPNRTQTNIF